ncbi:MAG: hypothetical protein ACKO3F_06320 [Cyanobium sp.]
MRRHISPTPSRPQTRLVLGALSSLALLATIQPLLLPRQPRLPQLPADLPLSPGWRVLSSSSSSPSPALPKPPQPRAYRPLFSPLAVGTGTVLEGPAGAQVRLTPMASWAASALDPASLSPAQAGSASSSPASSSPASSSPATCLTARGTLQSDRDALTELPPKPEPLPRAQKALATLLPSPDRSFNCLLVSTNRPQLLKQSASSQPLWPALSRAVRWPPPPGH